jgi:peptidoglycan-associated lipoprotein
MRASALTSAACALTLLVACTKPATKPTPKAASAAAKPEPAAAEKPAAEAVTPEFRAQGQAELDKAVEKLRNVRVFFEFDAATLTREAADRLTEVGEVLGRHQELDVNIEGHCDERGTSQYNLALGQKRADAVKKYLAQLGVKAEQIRTISFGAERPLDPGHDEEAWKKNRRADVLSTPDAPAAAGETPPAAQEKAPPPPAAAPEAKPGK